VLRKDLITCQQAAEILGRSPSTISRALAQGRLKYADPTRKLLVRQGLELRFANATRPKADCPQKVKRDDKAAERLALIPEPPGPPEIETSYWPRLHQKLTVAMAGSPFYWQREPNPHQLMLFCRTIDELRQQCELEGLSPP
jgi:hypothetical protein|tara:strand:+ start:952 stop:1377 length:426 start_codon:yes stop_codon:yes gene_type:complete